MIVALGYLLFVAYYLLFGVHLIFANIFVGAKHFGSKSLLITNKSSANIFAIATLRCTRYSRQII